MTVEVPGVPETDEAYRLGDDGLQRLRQAQGTGVGITLEGSHEVSAVVFTQDRLVINFLARQISAAQQQRNELVRGIAAQLYAAVVETHQQLLTFAPATNLTSQAIEGQSLSQARSELQHFERLLEGGGHRVVTKGVAAHHLRFVMRGQFIEQLEQSGQRMVARVFIACTHLNPHHQAQPGHQVSVVSCAKVGPASSGCSRPAPLPAFRTAA